VDADLLDTQDLPGRAESVQERHRKIEHGRVRLPRRTDRFPAVRDLRDDREPFAFEEGLQALPDDLMVIGEEIAFLHCQGDVLDPRPLVDRDYLDACFSSLSISLRMISPCVAKRRM